MSSLIQKVGLDGKANPPLPPPAPLPPQLPACTSSLTLLLHLASQLSVLDKYEQALTEVNQLSHTQRADATPHASLMSLCNEPAVVAQQLLHIELVRTHLRQLCVVCHWLSHDLIL